MIDNTYSTRKAPEPNYFFHFISSRSAKYIRFINVCVMYISNSIQNARLCPF